MFSVMLFILVPLLFKQRLISPDEERYTSCGCLASRREGGDLRYALEGSGPITLCRGELS
jgi:hypothetical protein